MHGLNRESSILFAVVNVIAGASVIATTLVLVAIACIKSLRRLPAFQIVFLIALNDTISSAGYLLSNITLNHGSDYSLCQLQGFILNYFDLASMAWGCVTAYCLLLSCRIGRIPDPQVIVWRGMIFSQVGSLLPSLVPFLTGKYGKLKLWCWVKGAPGEVEASLIRFFSFYFWSFLAVVFCIWAHFRILYSLRETYRRRSSVSGASFGSQSDLGSLPDNPATKLWRVLRFYPLVIVVSLFTGFVNRVYQSFAESPFGMYVAQVCTAALLGLLDALVFLSTPKARREIWLAIYGRSGLREELLGDQGKATSESSRLKEISTFPEAVRDTKAAVD